MNERLGTGLRFVPYETTLLDAGGDTVILRTGGYGFQSRIWYTFDGGDAWTHLPNNMVNGNTGDFLTFWQHQHDVWIHVYMEGVHRSLDYGQSWETYEFAGGWYSEITGLVQDTESDSTLFYTALYTFDIAWDSSYGGLVRSDDLGETWRPILDLYHPFGVTSAFVEGMARLSNNDLLTLVSYVSPPSWENGSVLLSADEGTEWTRISDGIPDRFLPNRVIEDRNQPGTVFLAGMQKYGLYWSHDYGRSWSRCLNGLPSNVSYINDLQQNPFSGAIYVAITGHGAYVTHDHGQSWQPMPMPPIGPIGYFGVAEETIFMRDDAYRQWRLAMGSNHWDEMTVPLAQDTLVLMRPVCYHSGDTLVSGLWKRPVVGPATDDFQMIYSYDNGQSWQIEPFLSFLPSNYFDVYRSSAVVRFLVTSYDSLYWSEDLGRHWSASLLPTGFIRTDYFEQDDSTILMAGRDYAANAFQVFRTADNGVTWRSLGYPGEWFHGMTAMTLFGNEFTMNAGGRCWHWKDSLWDERGVLPHSDDLGFMIDVPRPEGVVLFGVGEFVNQAWISADTGRSWQERVIDPPYPNQSYGFSDLKYDAPQQRIWAIAGVGTCYLEISELSSDGPLHFKPVGFSVLSVYPNPFNAQTKISYDLDRVGKVTLDVYDLTGRLVRTLVDDVRSAGRHSVEFDGSALASGTYFVKLVAGDNTKTQKMLLLK
jgi:photosystem II stability/assembly factor-like uncharacterized protein